ncbi:MAG: hydantoinase B/oxoprolinase family protein [Deltaproteobacteria bacterium]|nr:hydantoinase B/oxoprolinase family protein [Deltaproteobacteria bacterium]
MSVSASVDPVTFEILSHRLHQITLEMGTTLERVGGTVNTTQMHDYMAALYLPNGDVLSAGESMARHAACAGFAVKRIIERFEKDGGIFSDDIFLLNDPYLAAIHQSDIYMVSPIHYRDQLMGWSATFVHVMDIGAMSPGGNSPGATEICQEGLRIPGLKLVERGTLRQDVFDTLINMTRQPVMVGLDLKCEIAANNVAKARMREMLEQYGPELITSVSCEMIRYSESILKRRIQEIPDGVWTDSGAIQTDETWNVVLTLRKKGDRLIFDFTGSDPQAKRGINLPYHATLGACFEAVLTTLGYDLPRNHGASRPIEVIAPEGTVVNVRYPGPVSLNTTSGMKTVQYLSSSVLMQMLATSEKWQQEVMALSLGFRLARHAGVNQYHRYYVSTLLDLSGAGATATRDGMDSGGYLTAHNVEWIESNFPLFYLFRSHIKDGGGAGKFVGGSGAEAALALHDAPEGKIRIIAFGVAGLRNSGQGMFGGYPAAPSLLVLLEDTKVRDFIETHRYPKNLADLGGRRKLLPYCEFDLKADDVVYIRSASGGGYGDPLERDPKLVAEAFRNGLISKETVEGIYGVILDESTLTPNLPATQDLRLRLKQERSAGTG